MFLITKYAILHLPYNTESRVATWETSFLRKRLNGEFFYETFTESEQEKIVETNIVNNKINLFGVDGGNDTVDKVFILSAAEIKKYFKTNSERSVETTKHLIENNGLAPKPYYWLRSSGYTNLDMAVVKTDGSVNEYGYDACTYFTAVRPCICIKK